MFVCRTGAVKRRSSIESMAHEIVEGGFVATDDIARIDLGVIHAYLTRSYWAKGIPPETVRRCIQHSLCFGVYEVAAGAQVGFGRVISDRATYAYLADVFILEEFRGRGLSKLLMRAIMSHPDLQNLRRWMLMTRDAHSLYTIFGFTPLKDPMRAMERHDPGVYSR